MAETTPFEILLIDYAVSTLGNPTEIAVNSFNRFPARATGRRNGAPTPCGIKHDRVPLSERWRRRRARGDFGNMPVRQNNWLQIVRLGKLPPRRRSRYTEYGMHPWDIT